MQEIITDWVVTGASPGVTVMYFDEATALATVREAVALCWEECEPRLSSGTTWTVRTQGRLIDSATGTLTGFWNSAVPYTGTGTGLGATGADSTQVIMGWLTDDVVDGRRVQGRSFIPGLIQTSITNGNLAPAAQTVFQTAADGLAGLENGLVVWHRPRNGVPGSEHAALNAQVPSMLGVQRRRRA